MSTDVAHLESADGAPALGPVLLAYDGSELAERAIQHARAQLAEGRDALVLCVWQPADVGFSPPDKRHLRAYEATEVLQAAEETAEYGVSLAEKAGFLAQSVVVEASPTWKGIIGTAEDRAASLIVMGSHRHSGLRGHLVGSVASSVLAHAACPVLIVPHQSGT